MQGMFQSAPGPRAGRCARRPHGVGVLAAFQSAPGPRAGRCVSADEHAGLRHHVSIRARPEGRAVRRLLVREARRDEFQSAPGPRAGRCTDAPPGGVDQSWVSIRARPEGRAVHRFAHAWRPLEARFNPRPARGPGGAQLPGTRRGPAQGFNPRPARGPGGARWRPMRRCCIAQFQSAPGPRAGRCRGQSRHRRQPPAALVSIRARPEGRAVRSWIASVISAKAFQSAPGPRAGRC